VIFRKRVKKTYDYSLQDGTLSFDESVAVLRNRHAGRVLVGWPPMTLSEEENIGLLSELNRLDVRTERADISLGDYKRYLDQVNYPENYPKYYPWNLPEKALEHFLAFTLLDLKKNDHFIDVGAENSPHVEIFRRLSGCRGYVQDIMLKPGIHARKIGCDASRIPVAGGFFDAILAACSLEHFENDSDMDFLKEASRILRKKGKLVILPLYLHTHPFYVTDPAFSVPGNVHFGEKMNIHCVKEWGNRHGRFYCAETLRDRLIDNNSSQMEFKVIYFKNFKEIDPSSYCRFALLGTKK